MKKLIIICLLAHAYTNTNAQEPTKQETMNWIASKFKAYSGNGLSKYEDQGIRTERTSKYIFKKYEPSVIEIANYEVLNAFSTKDSKRFPTFSFLTIIKIDLLKITEVIVNESGVEIKGDKIFETKYGMEEDKGEFHYFGKTYSNNHDWEYSSEGAIIYSGKDKNFSMVNISSEPNLKERMIKAFQTLAKHNNAERPKEKF